MTNTNLAVVPFCLVVPFLLLCLVLSFVEAQDEGIRFLVQKEESVKHIALSAGMLDGNCTIADIAGSATLPTKCPCWNCTKRAFSPQGDVNKEPPGLYAFENNLALIANCQGECTRAVCNPRTEDLQAKCVRVEINDICPPTDFNKSCNRYMKLNYQRSYLTLPPPADLEQLRPEMVRDICLQRALDNTFKSISADEEFSYVYFGSLSGVFRAFPGRERPANRCLTFETRRRPWFKNGCSVQKQLKIVVDTGNSMGNVVPPNYPSAAGNTFLEVASNIILNMLKTMSPDDFVDVGTFNSSGYYQLSSPVQISRKFDEAAGSDELAALEDSVRSNLTRSLPGSPSNLTAAILNAVETFKETPSDTLKVIVIFTDGQFSPLNSTTFPTARILELKVKIILYKLPRSSDTDPFLRLTTLYGVLCNANGTFELLEPHTTSNPLFSIRSFYTFLAQTHLAVAKNQSTWSSRYLSVSQALNGTTVTYPAFGKDGQLIGVAGIDVYPDELNGNLRDLVSRALDNRSAKGNLPAPLEFINFACSYQTAVRIEAEGCSASVTNGGICEATDATTGLQQRVCCDGCLAPPLPAPPPTKPPGTDMALILSLGGVVAAILSLLLACYLITRFRRQCDDCFKFMQPEVTFNYPGNLEGVTPSDNPEGMTPNANPEGVTPNGTPEIVTINSNR